VAYSRSPTASGIHVVELKTMENARWGARVMPRRS
jgi:hypothetical protein